MAWKFALPVGSERRLSKALPRRTAAFITSFCLMSRRPATRLLLRLKESNFRASQYRTRRMNRKKLIRKSLEHGRSKQAGKRHSPRVRTILYAVGVCWSDLHSDV